MGAKQGAVGRTARRVGRSGRSAARSGWAKRLGRLGIAAKGSIYLLVAAIAIGVAAGERSDPKAQSGALATLAGGAVGKAMLIVLAVGLAGYALWRLSVAVLGTPGPDETTEPAERIGSLALALIYGSLCAYAIGIAAGTGTTNGASAGPDEATRTMMDWSLGTVLVLAVGALLAGLALFEGYKAASRSFMDELRTSQMSADQKRLATALGIAGHAARAVASALVAAFVIKAAVEHDPSEAIGLDGALEKLAAQDAGPLLLAIMAAGLATYGLYLIIEARFRRV